jgi:glutathione S-transferase
MTKPILYHCRDARSFRCLWAAEELGLDYELVTMPFPPRFHVPAYKEINPLGTIPCWIDGAAKLTESAAICQLLARGSSLDVTPDEPDYPAYLNWLHRSDATLTFPLAIMLRYSVFPKPEDRKPEIAEDYKLFFLGRAKSIEAALSDGRVWLVAGRFSMADVCIGYSVMLALTLGLKDELGSNTLAWWERLSSRDGFKSAKARQAQSTSPEERST